MPVEATRAGGGLELGVVGNGSIAALIDRTGRMVWCCWPRLDADPVFCALLQPVVEGGGQFAVELEGLVDARQEYLANTAVLVTRLRAADGAEVEIHDFAPRFEQHDRMFHAPTLVRQLRPVAGLPRIGIRLSPMRGYGAALAEVAAGSNHARYLLDEGALRVTTDAPVPALLGRFAFALDRPISFVLGPDETLARGVADFARDAYERTTAYWRNWVRSLAVPVEWQDAVIRAAITLKLCQYEHTGAIVAALTTSIPEQPATGRNWDYRYCWLRDSAFVIRALNRLSATRTMEKYLGFVLNVAHGGGILRPVYGISFESELPEAEVPHLRGFGGDGPVRVGNLACRQRQNDVYGSVILALEQLFFDCRLQTPGLAELYARLERLGELAEGAFHEPDAGLWELRTRDGVHTHSALMCWVAADRLVRIARRLGMPRKAAHWSTVARRLLKDLRAGAWNEQRSSYVDTFGGDRLDASLLLLPELGAVGYDDPRFRSTLRAIEAELRVGNGIRRYAQPDDFGTPDVAFNLCTFWYINALRGVGRVDEARDLFEHMLTQRTALGLLSEDLDPHTGEPHGNFPQTYSLVGLVQCAMRLSRRWEDYL